MAVAERTVNVIVATFFLIVLTPLMLLIAAAIRMSSAGPIFVAQPGIGLNRRGLRDRNEKARSDLEHGGRIFKFRTSDEADSNMPKVYPPESDSRISRLGKFLRLYRLDELPQLWNVLIGDMNLVGPRPEQRDIYRPSRRKRIHKPLGSIFLTLVKTVCSTNTFEASEGAVLDFRAEWQEARATDENWRARFVTLRFRWWEIGFLLKIGTGRLAVAMVKAIKAGIAR